MRGAPENNALGRKRHFTVEAGDKLTVKFLQLSSGRVCTDNSDHCRGGSILINGDGADVVIKSCAFVSWPKDGGQDYEARDGGFIRVKTDGSTLLIEDSTFVGGRAYLGGGALSLADKSVTTIRRTMFKKCQSVNDYGGAVSLINSATKMYVFDSTFESNTAEKGGGAVYVYGNSETVPNIAEFSSTKFIGNVAKTDYGGAIILYRKEYGWNHWHWWGWHWHYQYWKSDATFKDGFNMFVGNKCEADAR